MSAEQTTAQATQTTETAAPRLSIEDRVERIATYWGRAVADAWRTVFPPKENQR